MNHTLTCVLFLTFEEFFKLRTLIIAGGLNIRKVETHQNKKLVCFIIISGRNELFNLISLFNYDGEERRKEWYRS